MQANGNGVYQIIIDGIPKAKYTRDPRFTDHGHLRFTDSDGRDNVVSAGKGFTVREVPPEAVEASEHIKSKLSDGDVKAGYEVWG